MKMNQKYERSFLRIVEELGELLYSAFLETVKDDKVLEFYMEFNVEKQIEIGDDRRRTI